MNYEVLVVGGGIGGLTTAALLAARGVNVGLFERNARAGGCVTNFEQSGYAFEPTAGLYSGWGENEVYEKIFAELPVGPPQVDPLSPAYVVRLPDGNEVTVSSDADHFADNLRIVFPECANEAMAFYALLDQIGLKDAAAGKPASLFLADCSKRFRRFIDVQLQTFVQSDSELCLLGDAAPALATTRRGWWAIRGGAQTLADSLVQSFKTSGGSLRLNSPVLRLAYGSDGLPTGVDLLSGERVTATRAIVSNLTVWDTYGKLIGLGRTPSPIATQIRKLTGWGAYLLFLSMDRAADTRLNSRRILALTDWQENQRYSPEEAQFFFSAAPEQDARAPEGKLAVTVSTFTNAEDWFSFHEDEHAHDEQDQARLESVWSRLHAAIPELGDGVEVIETATPRTFYDNTRRKFGMVGRPAGLVEFAGAANWIGQTIFSNVFHVGDTCGSGFGLAGVSHAALELAELLTSKPPPEIF